MNTEGEILIRPNYEVMAPCGDDAFWAKKEDDSNLIKLDVNGETVLEIDYKRAVGVLAEFGIVVKDGRTCVIVGNDGKHLG